MTSVVDARAEDVAREGEAALVRVIRVRVRVTVRVS